MRAPWNCKARLFSLPAQRVDSEHSSRIRFSNLEHECSACRGPSLIQTFRIRSFQRFLQRSPMQIGHDSSLTPSLTKLAALMDSSIWLGDLLAGAQSLTQMMQRSIECWI